MAKAGHSGIFESEPNTQTVQFAGKYINLSAIARAQNIHFSYLSRIFAGKRMPSLTVAMKLSAVLSIPLQDFVEMLHDKGREVRNMELRIVGSHRDRINREDAEDAQSRATTGYAAPRLPALRSA